VATQAIEYRRPWMAPYQLAALFGPERYAIVEATSKAGKSVGCMLWLAEQAMKGKAGWNYWWVSYTFPTSKIMYRRLKAGLPQHIFRANETELTLTLANGAVIWFKSAEKPDALFGEDVYAAVMDEATRCREEAWFALRTTLTATRGPVRIIGNVKGRRNWAYRLARRAQAGEPNWSYAKITAYDAIKAGILDAEEIEDVKRTMPESAFRELYLAEPSDDAGNPFGLDAIRACVAPLSSGPIVCWGLDLAKSHDWCVLIGLDPTGTVAHFARWQGPWEATIQKVIGLAARSKAPVLVDSTGAGDPVLESLQRQGRTLGARFVGFNFSASSKQQLMEGLAVAIQRQTVRYPEGPIVDELEAFEYEYTRTGCRYSAPEGFHDDCVCGLALAVQQFSSRLQHVMPAPRGFGIVGSTPPLTIQGNV
jgi:hypothetical protein